jgi:hypothetical protein
MNSETTEDTEERRGGFHLSAGIYTDVTKLSSLDTLYQVDLVRWPGRKAGVRWVVRLEHLSALPFFVLFLAKKKRTEAMKKLNALITNRICKALLFLLFLLSRRGGAPPRNPQPTDSQSC